MPANPESPIEALAAPSYPTLESFVESAHADDLGLVFADVREALAALKGPRADQGRKVEAALGATEELIQMLLGIRADLEQEQGARGGRR